MQVQILITQLGVMLFYNESTQLEIEMLYKEEIWQDLQKPVDSEALYYSLLVDFLGKYVSLVIS